MKDIGADKTLKFSFKKEIETLVGAKFLLLLSFQIIFQFVLRQFLLTLVWVGRGNFIPCWFSLNSSKTVKAVALVFCSIQ